jgi:hypothetical protein
MQNYMSTLKEGAGICFTSSTSRRVRWVLIDNMKIATLTRALLSN